MIELRELTKMFHANGKSHRAVDTLSFEVGKGEIVGLLGSNGAGKTTTVRMLSTLVTPSGGDAYVMGHSILTEAVGVRSSLGVSLGDERTFYYRLSGYQNLEFFGTLQEVSPVRLRKQILNLMERLGLFHAKDTKFMKYSTGMKRKLNLCRAMLADPPVYLLDEPTSSLDPQSAKTVREMIGDLKRVGKTILLTTQNMAEAEQLCDRVALINRGRVDIIAAPAELKQRVGLWTFRIATTNGPFDQLDRLRNVSIVKGLMYQDGSYEIVTTDKMGLLAELFVGMKGSEKMIKDVVILEPTLEDVFLRHCEGSFK